MFMLRQSADQFKLNINKQQMIPNAQVVISSIDGLGVWEEYEQVREIATGTFGKVIMAREKFGYRELRAIKQIQINPLSDEQENEVKKLKALTNDHIVDYYGNMIENNELYIIMQYCKGNLRDQMKNYGLNGKIFQPSHIIDLVTQITSAMLTLTKHHILHLDLKPENILFLDEKYYKLCDFGCSQIFQNVSKAFCSIRSAINPANGGDFGTPAYIAPEVQLYNHSNPSNSCDVWAFGIILYELIYNKHPIGLNKLRKVDSNDFRKFIGGQLKIEYEPRQGYPIDIVKSMLKAQPKQRIKWDALRDYLIKKYGRHQAEFIDLENAGKSQILLVVIFTNIMFIIDDNIQFNLNSFWKKCKKQVFEIRNLLAKLGYVQMLKFKQIFQYKMKYKLKPKTLAEFNFMFENVKQEALAIKFAPEKEDGRMVQFEAQLKERLSQIKAMTQGDKQKFESVQKIATFIDEVCKQQQLFCNGHKLVNTCKIFEMEDSKI